MEPQNSPAASVRQSSAKFMKRAIFVCWAFMAGTVIAMVVANHSNPAVLAAITGAAACLAGIFGVFYQSAGKLARDPEYSLSAKEIALLVALGAVAVALLVWSTSL
jgi:multisubunit Na+/H+ antiporter MnhB subunit